VQSASALVVALCEVGIFVQSSFALVDVLCVVGMVHKRVVLRVLEQEEDSVITTHSTRDSCTAPRSDFVRRQYGVGKGTYRYICLSLVIDVGSRLCNHDTQIVVCIVDAAPGDHLARNNES
jgi:hypothetical protein